MRPDYQPSKAELEEVFDFSDLEGKSLNDMARAVLRTMNLRYVRRPRRWD